MVTFAIILVALSIYCLIGAFINTMLTVGNSSTITLQEQCAWILFYPLLILVFAIGGLRKINFNK